MPHLYNVFQRSIPQAPRNIPESLKAHLRFEEGCRRASWLLPALAGCIQQGFHFSSTWAAWLLLPIVTAAFAFELLSDSRLQRPIESASGRAARMLKLP